MLEPINPYLHRAIRKRGIKDQVEASQVVDAFHDYLKKIFGAQILKSVQAKNLKNRVLAVYVLNSVLKSELRLREPEILDHINTKYKKTIVLRLRVFL